jgi:hypothetical protein
MMDPTREPRPEPTEPTEPRGPHGPRSDAAVVAYLRSRAPGLPAAQFDPRTVTAHARGALRRRRLRTSLVAGACAVTAYLGLALAGPVPVPGGGTVSVPGSQTLRALMAGQIPGRPPGPDQRDADVDRIVAELLPVIEELEVSYYLLHEGPCRILKYARGNFSDQAGCEGQTPFDAQAAADFDRVTRAVERSGLAVERIRLELGGIYIQLEDISWQYNYEYVFLPDTAPPPIRWPEEQWTRVRDGWWFHRAHDD